MRRFSVVVLVATALLGMLAAAAASPSDLIPWLPDESYPGKAQADPRLDKPVRIWGAGIPLGKVFAAITEQTGVQFGFWPPGDVNERVCVNVYLNRERPPSLRELMAQLMWVTDCSFAYAGNEAGKQTYYLVGTTIGSGARNRLIERVQQASKQRAESWARIEEELRQKAWARLDELREAMKLTREQAIRRYRNTYDLMLLAVLDPARRKVAELLLSLPEEDMKKMRDSALSRPWFEWTPQQQAMLREAMQRFLRKMRQGSPSPEDAAHWADWGWILSQPVDVEVSCSDPGGFAISILRWEHRDESGGAAIGMQVPFLQLARDSGDKRSMLPRTGLEIRQALSGETVDLTDDELERIDGTFADVRWQDDSNKRFEANAARYRKLSKEAETRLRSMMLPVDVDKAYALWQIQEAVAATAGMSIVSDCFWQPARVVAQTLDLAYPDGRPELTELVLLTVSATASIDEEVLPGVNREQLAEATGWEWGDAGDFLRFRSVHRDLWREAFLPEDTLRTLQQWSDRCLPDATGTEAGKPVDVPIDAREWGRLWRGLTLPQRQSGGRLTCGDPTDRRNAYRHEFVDRLFADAQEASDGLDILGKLSDEQWERVRKADLKIGVDFPLEWVPEGFRHHVWPDRIREVLRVVDTERGSTREMHGDENASEWWDVQLIRDGEVLRESQIHRSVRVQPNGVALPTAVKEPPKKGPAAGQAETQRVGTEQTAEGGR